MSTDCFKDIITLDWWSYQAEAGVSPHKRRDTHVYGLKVWRGGRGGGGTLLHIGQMQTHRLHTKLNVYETVPATEVKGMTWTDKAATHR